MSESKIISQRKTRKGEIILSIDFTPIKQWAVFGFFRYLIHPFYNLLKFISIYVNLATGKKSHLIVSSGLGLGLGLGVILAFYPHQIQASPTIINEYRGVEIARIKSQDIGIDTQVKRGDAEILPVFSLEAPAVHLHQSASIGRGQAIIIQGLNKDYSLHNLSQAQLGDEIFIIGSNDGWYRYVVVETRVIPIENLNNLFSQSHEIVNLYTINPWNKTATLVMARPRN